jgi:methyl-accepting chemotaxis protein
MWETANKNFKELYDIAIKVKELQNSGDNKSAFDLYNKKLKRQHMNTRLSIFDIRSRVAVFRVLNEPLQNEILNKAPKNILIIKQSLDNIKEYLEKKKIKLEKDSLNLTENIFIVFIFVVLIGLLSFILSIKINNDIIKSINSFSNKLDEFFKFISFENNIINKAKVESKDEIGEMLINLNKTIDNFNQRMTKNTLVVGEMVLTMDKVEKGMYKCKVKSESKDPQITTLKDTMNNMMDSIRENIAKIEEILKNYENQNLINRVIKPDKITDEMASIITRVNKLGDKLSSNAKENLVNGLALSDKSYNINKNIEKLTSQSKTQTDSLQETTDAVNNITINLRENNNKTTEMKNLAITLKKSAETGNELTKETTIAMDKINESMDLVIESISQIDQIAFQTNILSLNAAVEAATAGEAGKGFAVVAGEVRNLAGRSAETSAQIRKIVDMAKDSSTQGDLIAKDMLKSFTEINNKIMLTSELVEDVSTKTSQQMENMETINNKLIEIDKINHDNFDISIKIKDIAKSMDEMSITLVDDVKKINFENKDAILNSNKKGK